MGNPTEWQAYQLQLDISITIIYDYYFAACTVDTTSQEESQSTTIQVSFYLKNEYVKENVEAYAWCAFYDRDGRMISVEQRKLNPGANQVALMAGIEKIEMIPRWWCL